MAGKRIVVAVTLGIASALTTAAELGAQCLLANPSFEVAGSNGATFGGWNQFGPTGASSAAQHGSRAALVAGPNTQAWDVAGFWQSLACAPGQRWAASVVVSQVPTAPLSGQSQALVNIEWRDGAGNLISYESHTAATAATPVQHAQVCAFQSGVAPAGTASIHFLLGVLQGPSDPIPQVVFDAVTCVLLGTPSQDSLQWVDFPTGRRLDFSGRSWRVKGSGYYGPGPNLFDGGSSAVFLDALGRLHLTVRKVGTSWYSSEVALEQALGYGDYVFTTRGRLDQLAANIVLGMFIWEYGRCYDTGNLWWNPFNEIDVEFSRWGNAGNANAQFVAQPADWGGNLSRFNVVFADSEVTSHAMRWLPDRVEYRSWRGGPEAESPPTMISTWTYAGPHIPRPEAPRVHLNLWQLSAPSVRQEVVFDAFTFRPVCPGGNCGVLAVDAPSPRQVGLAPAAPNPFASQTSIRFTLATSADMRLAVFDVAGRQVRTLAAGLVSAGEHRVTWDARDDAGARVPPGLYLYQLSGTGHPESGRVIVIE